MERLLRGGVVADEGPDGAEEALVVPAHQELEELRLAGEDAAHDLLVGGNRGHQAAQGGGEVHGAPSIRGRSAPGGYTDPRIPGG
jgi:hypothetical protein